MSIVTKLLFLLIIKQVFLVKNPTTKADKLIKIYENELLKLGGGKKWIIMPDKYNKLINISLVFPEKHSTRGRFHNSVKFFLFTRKNKKNYNVIELNNLEVIKKSGFNVANPTKIITHGWMSSGDSSDCITLKNMYLEKQDMNIFILDWSAYANTSNYPEAASSVRIAGEQAAKLISFLNEQGVERKSIHVIGHSLGAHVAGFIGKYSELGRITGLDPAGPLFNEQARVESAKLGRLTHSDAQFVDVIHTCGDALGLKEPIGHADFYPFEGTAPQPGCSGPITSLICSHTKAWFYFCESLNKSLNATKCNTLGDLSQKSCNGPSALMGEDTPSNTRGIYYFYTNLYNEQM